MEKKSFLVLGMDERQRFLINYLCKHGHYVTAGDNYINGTYDAILLPLPQTGKYLLQIIKECASGQYIYGCNFPYELEKSMEEKGIHIVDYCKVDGMAYANSVATAEGVICEAVTRSKINIAGSRCLIYGFGKCGEIIADRMSAMKARVSIMTRNLNRQQKARAYGYDVCTGSLKDYDFIVNTVSSMSNNNSPVFHSNNLVTCKSEVLILDIATGGGVDFEYCRNKNIEAVLLPGLPGKYAPKTSADILFDVIKQTLPEV